MKIESLLKEERLFEAPEDLKQEAYIKDIEHYRELHRKALEDPETF